MGKVGRDFGTPIVLFKILCVFVDVAAAVGGVTISGDISAGNGGPNGHRGGDARSEGGVGKDGASGGRVRLGSGTYRAGDAGAGGDGGSWFSR